MSLNIRTKLIWSGALVLLAGGLLGTPHLAAQTTNAPRQLGFDAFREISDRNIFNPNRYNRATGTRPPTPRTTTTRPATRVEAISLVGIMAYEKGSFAFFDGTGGSFTKALQVGGTIGEYTVTHIAPTTVKLVTGTNTVDLKVGMQLRREDEGDWFISETSDAPRRRVVASTRTFTRGGSRGESRGRPGEGGLNDLEPEIIVIDSAAFDLENGNNGRANGGGPGNGQPVQPEPGADAITDPDLLRLMQRRQEMLQ
jgi:hypothetical protein